MTFQAGQSGCPSGRPKGVKDRRSKLRDMIEQSQDQLVQKAKSMALDGNEQMLKLLLERILPPKLREEPISFSLEVDSLVEKSKKIIQCLSDGEITTSAAETLMRTVYMESKIYEAEELKKQVDELMKRANKA